MMNDNTYINNLFKFAISRNKEKERNDKIVSPSQMSLYYKCPRSWYLNYVKKHKVSEPSMTLIYGTAMHTVLQEWIKDLYVKGAKYCSNIDYNTRLKQILKELYLEEYNKYNQQSFTTPEELMNYYLAGVEILKYLNKKRTLYFPLKKMKLVGIEMPLYIHVIPEEPNVKFMGSIDLVLYDEARKKYLILDFKTSKKGWQKWDKEDKTKSAQIVLYKRFFSVQYGIKEENIEVEFLILKQIINEDALWPQKRIQSFKPTSGSRSVKQAFVLLEDFVKTCFKDGQYIDDPTKYPATQGNNGWNCTFCPYKDMIELCNPTDRV